MGSAARSFVAAILLVMGTMTVLLAYAQWDRSAEAGMWLALVATALLMAAALLFGGRPKPPLPAPIRVR